jgi:uncharacterized phage protein (TIGR01671 family)
VGRRPKYKIWDKQEKCWYNPTYEAYRGKLDDLTLTSTGELQRRTISGTDHESMFPDRYEVVEYIGLKDIDGKEIYENDIFTVNKSMGEIIYEEDRFRIRWIRNPDEYNEILRNIVHYVGIAVIGSRFSNPELLEAN